MNIEEFEKKMTPMGKKSRLDPFLQDIMQLKQKGYAVWQIAVFLKENGVTITSEGVRRFIASRKGNVLLQKKTETPTSQIEKPDNQPDNTHNVTTTQESHHEKLLKTLQQKRDNAEKK